MDGSAERGHERLNGEVSRRLLELEGVVPPSEIGELWVFPPLDEAEGFREFVLFTRFGDNGTRRLYSARIPPSREERRELPGPDGYTRERKGKTANRGNGDGESGEELPDQRITEHGAIPAGRLPGLVQRFRRRLGDDGVPVHLEVDGSRDRWTEMIGAATANGSDGTGNGAGAAAAGPAGETGEETGETADEDADPEGPEAAAAPTN